MAAGSREIKRIALSSMLLVLSVGTARPARAGGSEMGQKSIRPVVLFASWRDPSEQAFTVNVPEGWKVTGGTTRRTNVNVRHYVHVVSPGGGVEIFIGDGELLPNEVPDAMTARAGFREGQTMRAAWGGDIRLARYLPGDAYARGYALSKLCSLPGTAKTNALNEASRELAKRAADYGRATGATVRSSVGEATFECGKRHGYVRAATLVGGPPSGVGAFVWDVLELGGYVTTDPSAEGLARYVFENMTASFKNDPRWEASQAKALRDTTGAVTRSQQQMARAITQHAQTQARAREVDVMSGWVARNKVMDKVFERDTEARRGITKVEDPVFGSRDVRNDSNYYWTRPDGSIVGTVADTPPDYKSDWRQMQTR